MKTRPRLKIVSDKHKNAIIELEQEKYSFGSCSSNNIVLDDKSISSKHFEILQVEGSYVICDADSAAGTLVNNHQIDKYALNDGDLIQAGNVEMIYQGAGFGGETTETPTGISPEDLGIEGAGGFAIPEMKNISPFTENEKNFSRHVSITIRAIIAFLIFIAICLSVWALVLAVLF